jgi:signal transduction histidine kinase
MTPVLAAAATTYAGRSTSFAVLEIAAAALLLAAAVLLGTERGRFALAIAVAGLALVWLAPVAVGWETGPSAVRSAGLAVAPLLPSCLLFVAALIPPRRRAVTTLAAGVAAALAGASLALVLVRDPIRDLYCWSDCTVPPLVDGAHLALTRRLTSLVLGLEALAGTLAAAIALARLSRARRAVVPALAALAIVGAACAAYAVALWRAPAESPGRPLYEWLFVARSLSLVVLAAALVWLALRTRLVRGRVTRLAVDLEGDLDQRLARALGDPRLRLAYPVGDRVVDGGGRPLALAGRVMPIVGDDGVVALVESDVLTVEAIEQQLGPAAQLALGNERLRAEALARLADVTASRARIVETADAARRRMERDLHDGAQQRMLALGYDLRAALTIAETEGNEAAATPMAAALERAVAASVELRSIAHGIFPAELASAGLEPALDSLADIRPVHVVTELPHRRRYPPEVETAAYGVVAEAAESGVELDVRVAEREASLVIEVEGAVDWTERLVRVEDRVGAAGGEVHLFGRRLAATFTV